MSELIGRKLGQYEISGLLGEGGMATVYRAHQTSVRRDVAIKIIESRLARNPEFVRRFEREAMTIAALDHPHILKIYDFGRADDLLYLVMELKSGGSLAQRIRDGQISAEQTTCFVDHIASALDHAHSKGIVHRDLKPQNVLLDEGGNAFLTDFGIAKLMSGESTALTAGGMAMGTPGYMAPEQWSGQQIDARTDLYALAVMTYEMLTGQIPFNGDTPAVLMFQHLTETPLPLRKLRPDLPTSLEKVLIKAIAKQPDQRYQSAGTFAGALHEGLNGKIPKGIDLEAVAKPTAPLGNLIPSAPYSTSPRGVATGKGGRGILALGALGLVALVGIAVILLSGYRNNEEPSPTSAPSATAPVIAAGPTETTAPSATLTPTFTATVTDTPTATATESPVLPSLTPSPNQETLIAIILASETRRVADIIASYTLTPSLTPSETPDVIGTVRAADLTQTAGAVASFTKTPTPSLTPSNTFTSTSTPTSDLTGTARAVLDLMPTTHEGALFVVDVGNETEVIYVWEGPWRGDKSVGRVKNGEGLPIAACKKGLDSYIWCIVRLPSGDEVWISTRVGKIQPEGSLEAGILTPMTIPAPKHTPIPSAVKVPTTAPTTANVGLPPNATQAQTPPTTNPSGDVNFTIRNDSPFDASIYDHTGGSRGQVASHSSGQFTGTQGASWRWEITTTDGTMSQQFQVPGEGGTVSVSP